MTYLVSLCWAVMPFDSVQQLGNDENAQNMDSILSPLISYLEGPLNQAQYPAHTY